MQTKPLSQYRALAKTKCYSAPSLLRTGKTAQEWRAEGDVDRLADLVNLVDSTEDSVDAASGDSAWSNEETAYHGFSQANLQQNSITDSREEECEVIYLDGTCPSEEEDVCSHRTLHHDTNQANVQRTSDNEIDNAEDNDAPSAREVICLFESSDDDSSLCTGYSNEMQLGATSDNNVSLEYACDGLNSD
ncbi:hypothetical protein PI124_g11637 [Phytophthora idaei]|nr:hypothetical protein PI126_g11233 [Phytophthora idaei]KAG3243563.1 hypothetical protein PI124_g11637 [Phytophthora idaei]